MDSLSVVFYTLLLVFVVYKLYKYHVKSYIDHAKSVGIIIEDVGHLDVKGKEYLREGKYIVAYDECALYRDGNLYMVVSEDHLYAMLRKYKHEHGITIDGKYTKVYSDWEFDHSKRFHNEVTKKLDRIWHKRRNRNIEDELRRHANFWDNPNITVDELFNKLKEELSSDKYQSYDTKAFYYTLLSYVTLNLLDNEEEAIAYAKGAVYYVGYRSIYDTHGDMYKWLTEDSRIMIHCFDCHGKAWWVSKENETNI